MKQQYISRAHDYLIHHHKSGDEMSKYIEYMRSCEIDDVDAMGIIKSMDKCGAVFISEDDKIWLGFEFKDNDKLVMNAISHGFALSEFFSKILGTGAASYFTTDQRFELMKLMIEKETWRNYVQTDK